MVDLLLRSSIASLLIRCLDGEHDQGGEQEEDERPSDRHVFASGGQIHLASVSSTTTEASTVLKINPSFQSY